MGRPKKEKFSELDEAWTNTVQGLTTEEVKNRIIKVGIDTRELMEAKKLDQDLAEKKAIYDEANEVYKEGKKTNDLKVDFMLKVLSDRGVTFSAKPTDENQ